jgi:hypothetical protein
MQCIKPQRVCLCEGGIRPSIPPPINWIWIGHNVVLSPAPSVCKTSYHSRRQRRHTSALQPPAAIDHQQDKQASKPFITDQSSKRRFLNDLVHVSACSFPTLSVSIGQTTRPVATYTSPHASTPTQQFPRGWCDNLAQGAGLVTLTTSQLQ